MELNERMMLINNVDNAATLIRPPGTVVPGGLMFCCGFFFFSSFFCGTLRRYISEMAGAIALKLSHMIGSV